MPACPTQVALGYRVLRPKVTLSHVRLYTDPSLQLENTEIAFRLAMNNNAMATSKLAEGIRGFSADIVKLEEIVRKKLGVPPLPSPEVPTPLPPAREPNKAVANGDLNLAANGADGDGKTEFDQLAEMTKIVADTGEIEAIRKYRPTDATTNPSLLHKASQMKEYSHLVDDAIQHAAGLTGGCD